MRKLVYVLLLVTIAVFTGNPDGFAQENEDTRTRTRRTRESSEDREERLKERIDNRIVEMDKAVKLKDEQKKQILKILTEDLENTPQRSDRTQSSDERISRYREAMQRRQKREDAINAVLTTEQLKKYRAYQIKQDVDRRMASLDEGLKLKDNQKKKIRKILEQDAEKRREIMGQLSESSEDRTARRRVLQAQRSNTEKAIEKILTDEQKKKYKAMNTQRTRGRRRSNE